MDKWCFGSWDSQHTACHTAVPTEGGDEVSCLDGPTCVIPQHKLLLLSRGQHWKVGVEYAQAGQARHATPGGGKGAAEEVVTQVPAHQLHHQTIRGAQGCNGTARATLAAMHCIRCLVGSACNGCAAVLQTAVSSTLRTRSVCKQTF
jgi:hypothetical protein